MAVADFSTPGDGKIHFTSDLAQLSVNPLNTDATKHINLVNKDVLVVNTNVTCSAIIVTSATGGLLLGGGGFVTVGKLKIGPQPGQFENRGANVYGAGQAE